MTNHTAANEDSEISDFAEIVRAACELAVREAILDHKRAGNPIAEWRDGQVVWIPPEEILP